MVHLFNNILFGSQLVFIFFLTPSNIMGQVYHAVHIPEDKLSKINLDGNINEWSWIPAGYGISLEHLVDVGGVASYNTSDFDSQIYIAWSDGTNRVYIVAVVYDDVRSVDQEDPNWEYWLDDSMELGINPSKKGQGYEGDHQNGFYHTIKAHLSFPLSEKEKEFSIDVGPAWMKEKDHIDFGWKIEKDDKSNRFKITYEIGISLWDEWNVLGHEFSKRHLLLPNETIRMTIAFDDVDEVKNIRQAQWATFSGSDWWRKVDELSLIKLAPPLVRSRLDEIQLLLKKGY